MAFSAMRSRCCISLWLFLLSGSGRCALGLVAPINGIQLYYDDSDPTGKEGLPALVFLHGSAGNSASFWQQVPALQGSFRCIIPDQRGYGRSMDTTGEGVARLTDDLEALMDHLGVERVSLVAQSMGGRAGLGYATRHPERVQALIMGATWGNFDWPEQLDRAKQQLPPPPSPPPSSGGPEQREGPHQSSSPPSPPPRVRGLNLPYQEREPALALLYTHLSNFNPKPQPDLVTPQPGGPTLADVRKLQVPVMLISGSTDVTMPSSLLKPFADVLPRATFIEVPDAGHSLYWEQPEYFNNLVADFVRKHACASGDCGKEKATS